MAPPFASQTMLVLSVLHTCGEIFKSAQDVLHAHPQGRALETRSESMKKFVLIAAALTLAIPAFAQTAVTAPSASAPAAESAAKPAKHHKKGKKAKKEAAAQ